MNPPAHFDAAAAVASPVADRPFMDPARQRLRLRPLKAWRHFQALVADKEDTRQVFGIFEALPRAGFVDDARAFCESATGRARMASEPYLPDLLDDRGPIARLPEGTVGRAYLDFMTSQGLSAAGLVEESAKQFRQTYDDQMQWYRDRLRDTHDMLHILTGHSRDALGEACVLAFTFGQTGNYGNAFIAALAGREIRRGTRAGAPVFKALWQAYRNGKRSPNIINEDIRALLAEPLVTARHRLNIGEPVHYRACHAAFRGRGIDPFSAMATA